MKIISRPSRSSGTSRRLRIASSAILVALTAIVASTTAAKADSPTEVWTDPGTSLLKAPPGNWGTGGNSPVPLTGTTGVIYGNSGRVLGWNTNTNPGAQNFGDLDFTYLSGSSSALAVGNYTTKTTSTAVNVTLGGSTLNSQANTVIANSSTFTILFTNDVDPTGDYGGENATTTYTLGNATNVIQSTAGSNIIIDNVITGAGAALTYLGGGNGATTGATLELGAGSVNDVTGEAAPNAGGITTGTFATGIGAVRSGDQNTFTGGLTIGDAAGTANAGIVQADGGNALPSAGTITVNPNSQLLIKGNSTYGAAGQNLVLNGAGTPSNSGALATNSGDSSTWGGNINVASNSAINVQGAAGILSVTGSLTGSAQLQTTGAGTLVLNGNSSAFSGGFEVSNGTLDAGNANALGSGAVAVAGGKLGSTVSSVSFGGALSLSSGVIALDQSTFSLATGQNFTVTGGTIDLTDVSGSVGAISSAGGGTFSITSGVLDLGGNTWNYANTYNILAGFSSGSVSGLSITDYDTADYTASVSNAGVLSFSPAAVPEPSTWATIVAGLATLVGYQSRRSRRNRASIG
jgi:autotransporter-associated beta strand protein